VVAKATSWDEAIVEKLASIDTDAVGHAARHLSAPSWDEIGRLLPEAQRSLQAVRSSGRGPCDVAAELRLFELPEGTTPRVTLWRDQSAWCPYCQKVIMQLEEKRVPYVVRRAPMTCYSGGELQKPAEFLELSPTGKMPVATIDSVLYPDSNSILNAVEREFPGHLPLLPSTDAAQGAFEAVGAMERSFSSAWISWLTTPSWIPGDKERAREFTDSLDRIDQHLDAMSKVSDELGAGPYLLGSTFSLADVKLAPFMERAAASMPYFRALPIRTGGRWPALERWFEAMESRPAYAALRGDFYTHCLDLPPQLSPFGLWQSSDAWRLSAAIDGSDGVSWDLPLGSGSDLLEPVPLRADEEARRAAAGALWRNAAAVTLFACRGPAPLAAFRLQPASAVAMATTAALSVAAVANDSPYTAVSWAATTAVIYDILGTRAPLADPRAVPVRALVPLVDAVLRLVAKALLDDDGGGLGEARRQLAALEPGAAEPLRDALLYLRARIGVPRDMDYAAARQFRAYLGACVDALPVRRL